MKIGLIGYGEVGRILGEDLRAPGHAVTVYDVKLDSDAGEPLRLHAFRQWDAWVAELADRSVFGRRSHEGFARSLDWRLEADRLLAQVRDSKKEREVG